LVPWVDALRLAQAMQLVPVVVDDAGKPEPGLFVPRVFLDRSGQDCPRLLALSGMGSLDTLFKQ